MALSPLLEPISFGELPGWQDDDPLPALHAFARSAERMLARPYRTGSLGLDCEAFGEACVAALGGARADPRGFFETHFVPCRLDGGQAGGFVTGFYEPVVKASRHPSEHFGVPLLARPDDLLDITEDDRGISAPDAAFGRRRVDGRLIEYFDRSAIEQGALAGRGLELAWVADPVDAFFIHVQGAARLEFDDGTTSRITYAAKSGHRFTGPGRVLIELGELAPEAVTMQSIRAWFRDHPERVDEILWRNRSYIFFREAPVEDESLGPIAAAKVPLTAGHSLAVDRLIHTFGTPVYVVAPELNALGPAPFRRLMIAQDTGSAIVGMARGDVFTGSGSEAGEQAGVIKHRADFYVLVPRSLAGGGR